MERRLQQNMILEWRQMIITASHLTSNLTVCSKEYPGLLRKKHYSSALPAYCVGNTPITGGFPAQRSINVESAPCHDVFIEQRESIWIANYNEIGPYWDINSQKRVSVNIIKFDDTS